MAFLSRNSLLKTWLVLAMVYLMVRVASTYLVAGYFRFDAEGWADAALIPLFQALLLTVAAQASRSGSYLRLLSRMITRFPAVGFVMVADLVLITRGWLPREQGWAHLDQRTDLLDYYFTAKAVTLGVLLIFTAARPTAGLLGRCAFGIPGAVCGLLAIHQSLEALSPKVAWGLAGALAAAGGLMTYRVWRRMAPSAATALAGAGLVLLPASLLLLVGCLAPRPLAGLAIHVLVSLTLVAMSLFWLGLAHFRAQSSRDSAAIGS